MLSHRWLWWRDGEKNSHFHIFFVSRKYDLKGSTVDREASVKELEKDLPTLKDNDFMKEGTKIHIGEEAKQQLMETLTADVEVRNSKFVVNISSHNHHHHPFYISKFWKVKQIPLHTKLPNSKWNSWGSCGIPIYYSQLCKPSPQNTEN